MTTGMLLGKFCPFHRGHEYMINFARNYCDKLVVIVGSMSTEPIPGETRARWISERFPDVYVHHLADDDLPQDPTDDGWTEKEFREVWIEQAKVAMLVANMDVCDFYFASEDYGHWMAAGVGAEYVPVDPRRYAYPVSGTVVREAGIYGQWANLPNVVRKDYIKKITLFGPESTGKTQLAKYLAKQFSTVWVPEYGRIYTEEFGSDGLMMGDFERIRKGHEASVKASLDNSGPILIEDTDPLMTAVWCEVLTGSRWFGYGNPIKTSDYYLLMDVDLPWEDDGTRYFPTLEKRKEFFETCRRWLEEYRVPYDVVSGIGRAREERANELVTAFIYKNNINGPMYNELLV